MALKFCFSLGLSKSENKRIVEEIKIIRTTHGRSKTTKSNRNTRS